MEPRISVVRTSDGVDIAYAVSGSGPVLISVPSPPDNHIQLELDQPDGRQNVEAFSRRRTLVRFDGRGTGLSQRDVADFSLEARLRDLEAVADRVGAERFALLSGSQGNQVTVAYAARHPDRVTHLIAVNPFVHGKEFLPTSQRKLLEQMLAQDFRLFTENVGAMQFGWGNEDGPRYGSFYRQCVTAETALALYNAMMAVDLAPILEDVRCPVLVFRYANPGVGSSESTRRFVAAIPNSTFVLLGGATVQGSTTEMRRHMGTFFGEDWSEPEPAPVAPPPSQAPAGDLRILLVTDMEEHTSMMQRLGDARGREVLREHERITREALAAYGGAEVKAMGDGFLASFSSSQRALECASSLQRELALASQNLPSPLRVRVGVNAGEPIVEGEDLFGSSVIAASRIAARAAGGQVLVADVVRQLVAGKGFLFSDHGYHELKGFEEPVRLWELRWDAS